MMEITIVWEKDRPYFVSDNNKGDCILLNVGLEYIDDIEISGEMFFVILQKDASGWKANIDKEISHGIIHGDMVHELVAEINNTLETRGSFDIIAYVMSNKEEYAYLTHLVCWIEKYRPAPPGISRLVHSQERKPTTPLPCRENNAPKVLNLRGVCGYWIACGSPKMKLSIAGTSMPPCPIVWPKDPGPELNLHARNHAQE
jgi:hypothetical protein